MISLNHNLGRHDNHVRLFTFVAGMDEDEEVVEKRKRKRKREGDSEDDLLHIMDELPTEKSLQCQVHRIIMPK